MPKLKTASRRRVRATGEKMASFDSENTLRALQIQAMRQIELLNLDELLEASSQLSATLHGGSLPIEHPKVEEFMVLLSEIIKIDLSTFYIILEQLNQKIVEKNRDTLTGKKAEKVYREFIMC
ncbi:MAG: hypothetical protein K2N63_06620 [Lachnospiraceae bacterium]|nr:hypothetical protein [Lachnospiraceae bacterium]